MVRVYFVARDLERQGLLCLSLISVSQGLLSQDSPVRLAEEGVGQEYTAPAVLETLCRGLQLSEAEWV